jgi:tRNA-dihydrouridine synthase B
VFGSGDCVEAGQVVDRLRDSGVGGVLVGRGALRNPWIFAQTADAASGGAVREVPAADRGRFLLEYIELLLNERVGEQRGFRHAAPGAELSAPARSRERWVINKVRALGSWYTKGLVGGSDLRTTINATESIEALRDTIRSFFGVSEEEAVIAG